MSEAPSAQTRVRAPAGLWWLLAAFAALALGWYLGRSSASAPLENSADVRFARDMRVHHEQAVDMSMRLLLRTNDSELKIFLTDIILTQENQIGQMTAWLALWGVSQAGKEAPMQGMESAMGMATQQDVRRISSLPVQEAEVLFLQLMYRHHQGGVSMATDIFEAHPNVQVARMAQGIIAGQRIELTILADFLHRRNAALPEPLPPMHLPR